MDQEPVNAENEIVIPAKILEIAVLKNKKEEIEEAIFNSKRIPIKSWLIVCFVGGIYGIFFQYISDERSNGAMAFGAFICIIVFVLGVLIFRAISNARKKIELRQLKLKLIAAGAQDLKDNIEKEFFTKLVEINFKYGNYI